MQITYAFHSIAGPVRPNNEDSAAFGQGEDPQARRDRGVVMMLADGVGGENDGEIASRLACDAALHVFEHAPASTSPGTLLYQMFTAANAAVHDERLKRQSRMATTLSISLLRHNQLNVAHVGDCRVYLIQEGHIRRVTNDHSYAGVQVKLGLITAEEAGRSQLQSVLTRCVGLDAFIRADYHTCTVNPGDWVIHACDGVYCHLAEWEIYNLVTTLPPQQACRDLVALAESRGADDNLSVQIAQIKSVERVNYYRGVPIYQRVRDLSTNGDIEPGELLDNRYQIEELIARSGMATIYKATETASSRTVAIKLPLMRYENDPGFYSRFKREQEIGQKLHHPYILHVEPDDGRRGRPYMVMEYLEGQTLGHLMQSVRPMPEKDSLQIASRICEGLHYMHEHDVVHRDLKPDNIMICTDGSIRIMDFGIAKVEHSRRLTFGNFQPAMGTPDYMAPEQVRGKRGDRRTDVYSLGAILYEMLTGSMPFNGKTPLLVMNARLIGDPVAPRKRNPMLTPQVEEIVLQAMARDPSDRYPNALTMKQDLDHPDSVQMTNRAMRLRTVAPWQSGFRRSWLLAFILVAAVVGGIILWAAAHLRISFIK